MVLQRLGNYKSPNWKRLPGRQRAKNCKALHGVVTSEAAKVCANIKCASPTIKVILIDGKHLGLVIYSYQGQQYVALSLPFQFVPELSLGAPPESTPSGSLSFPTLLHISHNPLSYPGYGVDPYIGKTTLLLFLVYANQIETVTTAPNRFFKILALFSSGLVSPGKFYRQPLSCLVFLLSDDYCVAVEPIH